MTSNPDNKLPVSKHYPTLLRRIVVANDWYNDTFYHLDNTTNNSRIRYARFR